MCREFDLGVQLDYSAKMSNDLSENALLRQNVSYEVLTSGHW